MKNLIGLIISISIHPSYSQSFPKTNSSFIVIAHRGDHTRAPENTLKAYKNAIEIGADYIEVDLRTTKDSQLVVIHNESVNAMTNGTGKVHELTLTEIKNLMVVNKNHPEYGSERIPTFEEVLELAMGKINIYLDFKKASIEDTWKVISANNMEKNIVVYANTPIQLIDWKKQHPEIAIITSIPENIRTIKKFKDLANKFAFDIIDGDAYDYTRSFIKKVQKAKKQIWIDAQSPEENEVTWNKILKKRIHVIQTDHPEDLLSFLKKRKLR